MMPLSWRALLLTGLFILAGALASAEEPIPTGYELADKFIDAIGGREALAAVKTRVIRGQIDSGGRKGTTVTYAKRPDLIYSVIEFEDGVKVERGRNGDVVWERNAGEGAQAYQGEMNSLMKALLTFDTLDYRSTFTVIENEGLEAIEGQPCYRVRYEAEGIEPLFIWYDKETSLPNMSLLMFPFTGTHLRVRARMLDYRDVDGILIPFETREVTPVLNTLTTVGSVSLNEPIDDSVFDLPEELRK